MKILIIKIIKYQTYNNNLKIYNKNKQIKLINIKNYK